MQCSNAVACTRSSPDRNFEFESTHRWDSLWEDTWPFDQVPPLVLPRLRQPNYVMVITKDISCLLRLSPPNNENRYSAWGYPLWAIIQLTSESHLCCSSTLLSAKLSFRDLISESSFFGSWSCLHAIRSWNEDITYRSIYSGQSFWNTWNFSVCFQFWILAIFDQLTTWLGLV